MGRIYSVLVGMLVLPGVALAGTAPGADAGAYQSGGVGNQQ